MTRPTPKQIKQVRAMLLQENREVTEAYRVHGAPSAVVVSPNGRIGSTTVIGDMAVQQLVGARN